MSLTQYPYAGESDWQAIADLIQADPAFHHPVDFPWRLCSTTLEDFRNAALWKDEQGELRAFAGLQFPWLTVDYAIHPQHRSWDLETQILRWSEARLRQIGKETNDEFPFNVSAFEHEQERIAFLESEGYVCWENHLIQFTRSLRDLPEVILPEGFIIRPLDGENEIEQYVALHRTAFDSTAMTAVWRQHTLRAPLYNSTLDLVAVAPDGRLAGFCIWWYAPHLKIAQIEPMGVHPDFRQLGLSQALMNEGFRRVTAQGAEIATVETYSFSEPAIHSYEAAGFQPTMKKLKFYKEYPLA